MISTVQTHSATKNNSLLRIHIIKDASSVFLYPCNRSQILQFVKYNKYINIAQGIAKKCYKSCVFGQKVKTLNYQIKNPNPSWSQELNPEPLAPKADTLPLHHRAN